MKLAGRELLQLGDPGLRVVCHRVVDVADPHVREETDALIAALDDFRRRFGFGRGIAAPQVGVTKRIVALYQDDQPMVLINPTIVDKSTATYTMWDDCMSFPSLLVRVRRHRSISVRFEDLEGHRRWWEDLPWEWSELLQHEIDHLDGILAIDRQEPGESLIMRGAYEARPAFFNNCVDDPRLERAQTSGV